MHSLFFLFFFSRPRSCFHALLYDNELPPYRNIFPGELVRGPEEEKKRGYLMLTLVCPHCFNQYGVILSLGLGPYENSVGHL